MLELHEVTVITGHFYDFSANEYEKTSYDKAESFSGTIEKNKLKIIYFQTSSTEC